jgi:hypothetical protein
MDTSFLIIAIPLIIVVIILSCLIQWQTYTDAVKELKIGNQYKLFEHYNNPFAVIVTIVEIRYGYDNEPYVKYQYPNGDTKTMQFRYFHKDYVRIHNTNKGEL